MAIMESLGYSSLVLELTASGCASQCGTGWGGACTSQSPGGKEMTLNIGSFGEVLLFTKMCSSIWEEKKQHKLLYIRPATMESCYNSCDWRNVGKGCFPEWREKGCSKKRIIWQVLWPQEEATRQERRGQKCQDFRLLLPLHLLPMPHTEPTAARWHGSLLPSWCAGQG